MLEHSIPTRQAGDGNSGGTKTGLRELRGSNECLPQVGFAALPSLANFRACAKLDMPGEGTPVGPERADELPVPLSKPSVRVLSNIQLSGRQLSFWPLSRLSS